MKLTNFINLLATATVVSAAAGVAIGCQQEPVGPERLEGDIEIALQMEDLATKVDIADKTGAGTWTTGDEIAVHVTETGVGTGYRDYTINAAGSYHFTMNANITLDGYVITPSIMCDYADPAPLGSTPRVIYRTEYDMTGRDLTSPTFSYVPMMAVNDDELLYFYHVGGLVRLAMQGVPEGTNKVVVTFDGMTNVTGTCTVSNPGTVRAAATITSGSGNVVTFTNVNRTAANLYLNIPIPTGDYSALTSITVEAFQDATSKGIVRINQRDRWSTVRHAHGRVIPVSFTSNPISGVRLSSTADVTLWKSQKVQRTAVPYDAYGLEYQDATIVWSTSDDTIASVDAATGLVTAESAGGPVTITATATPSIGGTPMTATYQVYVNAITGIDVLNSHKVYVGGTKTITATLTNTNNGTPTGIPADLVVSWVSSTPAIVAVASATTSPTRVNSTTMTASVVVNGIADGSATLTASVYGDGSVTDNNNTITCMGTTITGGTPYLFRGKYLYPGILKYESSAYGVTGELEGLASVMAAYGTAAGRTKHYFSWNNLSSAFTTSAGVITGTVYNDGVNTWRIPTQSEWDTIINTAPTSTTKVGSTTLSKGFAEIVINLTGSTLAGQGLTTDGIGWAGNAIADEVAFSRTNYIAGLLLIPDGATVSCPRMKGTVGDAASWSVSTNCITYDDLEILVNGGCVFLPAAGRYNGGSWYAAGLCGYYWSATQGSTSRAYYFYIGSSSVNATNLNDKPCYKLVRLVRE